MAGGVEALLADEPHLPSDEQLRRGVALCEGDSWLVAWGNAAVAVWRKRQKPRRDGPGTYQLAARLRVSSGCVGYSRYIAAAAVVGHRRLLVVCRSGWCATIELASS